LIGLRAENLTRSYSLGGKTINALNGVSFEVQSGEFLGVVGRSGSGKSTLLNLLAGLDRPSSGFLWVDDKNLAKMTPLELAWHRQHTVGIVFQSFHLVPTMSARENVELAMAFAGVGSSQRAARASDLLDTVSLADRADHLPAELSGGEQQRVAIARALANSPGFLLADEPTGNLDSSTAEEILGIFQNLHAQGNTVICVTHEKELLSTYVDRFIRLSDGKVESEESPQNDHRDGSELL
jgi:putative ABC transport system ATP-binding protein